MEPKRRERLLILAAAICVGVFAGDRLLITPLTSLYKARTQRIQDLEKTLSKGRALVEREDYMRKRWKDMKENSLPLELSLAEEQVLQAMSGWTRASGLSILSYKPRWIEDEDDHFKKIDCRISAKGSVSDLVRFLYELETDPLALRLEQVVMSSNDENGRDLTLGVRFTGLVLMEDEG